MIEIQNTIVSDEIFEKAFICDLCKCKGQCCVEGESGAPLTLQEYKEIKEFLPKIWDDLSENAKKIILQEDIAYVDTDGELVTSIINGDECVFTYFDEQGVCKCIIDKAFREGRINVQKPISCHLYPIRLQEYKEFIAVNYHKWSVCNPARRLGNRENVKVYQFLKEPIIRRFGEEYYKEVCEVADLYFSKQQDL